MYQIDLEKAKSQMESLVQAALSGEEVVITLDHEPVVKLVPIAKLDTLYLRFKEGVSPTHSKDDPDRGVIYDYRGRSLIGIEILDASQG